MMQEYEVKSFLEKISAFLKFSETAKPAAPVKYTMNLAVAGTRVKLPGSVRSLYFEGSDSDAKISIFWHGRDDSYQAAALPLRDGGTIELEHPANEVYAEWSAQSGKTGTLWLMPQGTLRSGRVISVTSGGVVISEGSANVVRQVTVVSGVAGVLMASTSLRKVSSVINTLGVDVFVGPDATITDSGATKGRLWPAGASLEWKNTSALYYYALASGTLEILDET